MNSTNVKSVDIERCWPLHVVHLPDWSTYVATVCPPADARQIACGGMLHVVVVVLLVAVATWKSFKMLHPKCTRPTYSLLSLQPQFKR